MNAFDPKKFATASKKLSFLENIFQGPITGEKKLPSVKKHKLLDCDVRLVGYPDRKGCFSVRELGGKIDVALMDCNPREVQQSDIDQAVYFTISHPHPGWGWEAMAALQDLLKS